MSKAHSSSEPLFSIIIPTYGRSQLLREALESVLSQTIEDFECLVVDDASPAPVIVAPEPRIRVIRRPVNGGPAAARNSGLDAARGRYVAFLDDDDVFRPNRLELALPVLGSADIAICHRADLTGASRTVEWLDGNVHDAVGGNFTPSLGQTVIRRDVCPRFDERFLGAQDVDWWLRASRHLLVGTAPDVGYLVRAHGGHRHLNGLPARITGSRLLLETHSEYFAANRSARAFRELRIGLMALQLGNRREARTAFMRSLRARPQARTLWYMCRTFPPGIVEALARRDGSIAS